MSKSGYTREKNNQRIVKSEEWIEHCKKEMETVIALDRAGARPNWNVYKYRELNIKGSKELIKKLENNLKLTKPIPFQIIRV